MKFIILLKYWNFQYIVTAIDKNCQEIQKGKEKAKEEAATLPEDDTAQKEMARQEMLKVPAGAVKYTVDVKASKIEWSSEKKLIDWKHNGTVQIESGALYKSTDKEMVNGIDRIDSSKGYVFDNCVPCCKHCNIMKMTMTIDEFINKIKKILNVWVKREEDITKIKIE